VPDIEIRGFLHLSALFKSRGWSMPYYLSLPENVDCISGRELLAKLEVDEKEIEATFINGKANFIAEALIKPGDRVGLVPPGVPGPYRVYLGFVKL
jgi:hypothetical protein